MLNKLSFEIPRTKSGRINSKRITEEMFNEICSLTNWIENTSRKSITERVYCLEHNIFESPKCPKCGNNVYYFRQKEYAIFCSYKCAANADSTKLKRIETK